MSNNSSFGNWRGGGGNSRGSDRGYDRDSRPTMHRATCAKCNNSCEVPFKPNGRKPIYCSDCFVREDDGPRNDRSRSYDRPHGDDRRPSYDRPRSNDRPRPSRPAPHHAPGADNKEVVKHLKTIGIKMDHMIKLLTGLTEAMMEGIEEIDEEIEDEMTQAGDEQEFIEDNDMDESEE